MSFVAELRQRKLVQWALAYVAAAFAALQCFDLVAQRFGWPEWVERGLIIATCIGFFVTLLLAWYHGERGEQKVSGTELLLLALLLGIGGGLLWKFAGTGAGSASVSLQPAASGDHGSIAVLPFVDMSQAHDQEYFSDGLSEELLNLLAQLPQLRVIARTSSFSFKGKEVDVATIARALGVANVLEGSVRKSGNTLRITAQLIRAADSSHLWSQTYDRELTDVFKVQDEIAGEVVAALKVQLLPDQVITNPHRSANVEAYTQYLLGNSFFERGTLDGWEHAIAAYRKAIELDGNYAAAYAALGRAESFVADRRGDPAGMQQALADAAKAIALAPELADGYLCRLYARLTFQRDWAGAQADMERALALSHGDSNAQLGRSAVMRALGRLPEAIAATRKANDLDPLSAASWSQLGRELNSTGDLPAARKALDRALEISPDSEAAHFHRGINSLLEGKAEDALADFRKSGKVYGGAGIAMAEHALGHTSLSQQALEGEIAAYSQGAAFQIAQVYAWRGEKDKAFEWLDRSLVQRDGGLSFIQGDPLLEPLRADPRYRAFLEKLGLPH